MNQFETGPIRPPSEAGSYLIRLTRGCPWNRCGFCTTYRREKFSIRAVDAVKADIDAMAAIRDKLLEGARPADRYEWMVGNALQGGGRTAFLQDADSLAMKPDDVRAVLVHLRERFPELERVTTYARSRTLSHRSVNDLSSYRELGLNRIHVGMETAHDPLLELVSKGVTYEDHVKAGKRVVAAGIELSEYVMPGLGGREMTEGHARDTAAALSEINPGFIRLRTLCLHPKMALAAKFGPGGLTRLTDVGIVAEIRRFIEALEVRGTVLASDHILNLLGDLEGELPRDKARLLAMCDDFLSIDPREQKLFQAGRRAGLLTGLSDLDDPALRERAEAVLDEIGEDNLEKAIQDATGRFV